MPAWLAPPQIRVVLAVDFLSAFNPTVLLPSPMPINRQPRFPFLPSSFTIIPLERIQKSPGVIPYKHASLLWCSRCRLAVPSWTAEDSEWALEGDGVYFGEAPRADDEGGGHTIRSLGCKVRMTPPGDGTTKDLLSLKTQQQGRPSRGMGRSQRLRLITWSASQVRGMFRTWSST